jgi:hypothetical protein
MIFDHIDENVREGHKTQWSNLRGQGNTLDLERAIFLNNVLRDHLNNDLASLESYLVGELEEYKGKRSRSLVRMVEAFKKDKKDAHWRMLGGHGMVLLTRVDGRSRSRVLEAVIAVLKNTKRDSISPSSFRNILKGVLGSRYDKVRLETRADSPKMSYREQAIIFQRQILNLLPIPGVRAALSRDVKVLLRLDGRSGIAS